MKDALAPWRGAGYYLNFAEERGRRSPTATAPTTYARLQAVKARLDPENVIRANHAI